MTNRVVITGYGITSPIGNTLKNFGQILKLATAELIPSKNLMR
jgi:3-oxoacyl-(acyl-carrier-protein) synthase